LKWYVRPGEQWTAGTVPDILGQGDRIAGLAGPLAEFLGGRREAIATAPEGRAVLKLVHACYESAQTGTRIYLK
jgi:predicted dehydrogenase